MIRGPWLLSRSTVAAETILNRTAEGITAVGESGPAWLITGSKRLKQIIRNIQPRGGGRTAPRGQALAQVRGTHAQAETSLFLRLTAA